MFDGMKVFSTSRPREREALGEMVTSWLASNKDKQVVDTTVRQSSDRGFHCLSIVLAWKKVLRGRAA